MPEAVKIPGGGDYQTALFNPNAFKDPALRGGEVVRDVLGMPKPISGNFASVFTVNGTDGRRWAVKCFTRNVPDQAVRYQQVSKALQDVGSPWKVRFEYLTDGVLCNGAWYPVLKMEWVEATGLLPYVEAHLTDQEALAGLAGKFGDLVRDLSRYGIAHGDLQHGNILVAPSGELKLIDYDGMFVPGLDTLGASEKGHANYQSPLRTMDHWGPDLDRFSSWVIYASLSALALDPLLWQALHDDGDETLLFHQHDFTDRDESRARYALLNSSVAELRAIAGDIDFLWAPDLAEIPPLESILPGTPTGAAAPAAGDGWVRQHQAAGASSGALAGAGQARPIGAAAWLPTHLPAGQHADFSRPRGLIRAVSLVLVLAAALFAALPGLGPLAVAVAMVLFGATDAAYLSSPEGREKRRSRKVFNERKAAATLAAQAVSNLEYGLAELEWGEKRNTAEADRKTSKAHADEQREKATIDKQLELEIKRLDRRISDLQGKASNEEANALRIMQQAHIDERLRAARVSTAGVTGIGRGIAASLAASGIVTAADFTSVRLINNNGTSRAVIVLRNGMRVSPRGVGQQRALALGAWRQTVENLARATQPAVLPPVRKREIAANYAQQTRSLEGDQQAARTRAEAERATLRKKWATVHADIAKELEEANARLPQLRAEKSAELATAHRESEAATWKRDLARRELNRYQQIRYRRYVRRLVTG